MDFKGVIAGADPRIGQGTPPPPFSLAGKRCAGFVHKVYDGDTARATIMLDGRPTTFRIRVLGIDTPELRSKDALEKRMAYAARDRARALVADRVCAVEFSDMDKYGRSLARVVNPDGVDLAAALVRERLAYPYDGGTKNRDWAALST